MVFPWQCDQNHSKIRSDRLVDKMTNQGFRLPPRFLKNWHFAYLKLIFTVQIRYSLYMLYMILQLNNEYMKSFYKQFNKVIA